MAAVSFRNHRVVPRVLAALVLLLPRDALSDLPEPRLKLGPWAGDLKIGPGMNAAGKDLRGSEFVTQDLAGAVFDGSDLRGVLFWACPLSRTSFKGAHLDDVTIDESYIEGADFTDAVITGLHGDVRLSPQQLQSTQSYKTKDLRGCLAISAFDEKAQDARPAYDFRGAHLEGAKLSYGDFSACDFTDARIDRIELYSCKLTLRQLASTKDFKDRKLRHMVFRGTFDGEPDFSGFDLTGTRFAIGRDRHALLRDAVIRDCAFTQMLRKEDLYSTKSHQQGDLSGITFEYIDMSGWDFSHQNLTGCRFWGCNLAGARFDDAVMTRIYVGNPGSRDTSGLKPGQIESTWNYKHGRMARIVPPKEVADSLGSK
jgi:uncharacterized protein YjbI with pentapeptide repeats